MTSKCYSNQSPDPALLQKYQNMLGVSLDSIWDAPIPNHMKHEMQALALKGQEGKSTRRTWHSSIGQVLRLESIDRSCGDRSAPRREEKIRTVIKNNIPGWQTNPVPGEVKYRSQVYIPESNLAELPKESHTFNESPSLKESPTPKESTSPSHPVQNGPVSKETTSKQVPLTLKQHKPLIKKDIIFIHDLHLKDEEIKKLGIELKKNLEIRVHCIARSHLCKGIAPKDNLFLAFYFPCKQTVESPTKLNYELSMINDLYPDCVAIALQRQASRELSIDRATEVSRSGFSKRGKFEQRLIIQSCSSNVKVSLLAPETLPKLVEKIKTIYDEFQNEE